MRVGISGGGWLMAFILMFFAIVLIVAILGTPVWPPE